MVFCRHEITAETGFEMEIRREVELGIGRSVGPVGLVVNLLLIDGLEQIIMQQFRVDDGVGTVWLERCVPGAVLKTVGQHRSTDGTVRDAVGIRVIETQIGTYGEPGLDVAVDIGFHRVLFIQAADSDSFVLFGTRGNIIIARIRTAGNGDGRVPALGYAKNHVDPVKLRLAGIGILQPGNGAAGLQIVVVNRFVLDLEIQIGIGDFQLGQVGQPA